MCVFVFVCARFCLPVRASVCYLFIVCLFVCLFLAKASWSFPHQLLTIPGRSTRGSGKTEIWEDMARWGTLQIIYIHLSYNGYKLNSLLTYSLEGFIAQLVEHRTSIAEVVGSNPIESSDSLHSSWKSSSRLSKSTLRHRACANGVTPLAFARPQSYTHYLTTDDQGSIQQRNTSVLYKSYPCFYKFTPIWTH